jgi:hypothetical protein
MVFLLFVPAFLWSVCKGVALEWFLEKHQIDGQKTHPKNHQQNHSHEKKF